MVLTVACSDSNLSGNDLDTAPAGPANIQSTGGGGGNSPNMQFTLSPVGIGTTTDGNQPTTQSTNNYLVVNSTFSQTNSQTTVITASADGQNSQPQEYIMNLNNAAARHLTTDVTYTGGGTLDYTVEGQQKTGVLNQQQEQLMTDMQQQYNTAQTAYDNIPAEVNQSNPLMTKSDEQIKQMLETEGFTVTKLGNKRFQISETNGDITTTQIFNAQTFSTDSYEIDYQGSEAYGEYFDNGGIQTKQTINN